MRQIFYVIATIIGTIILGLFMFKPEETSLNTFKKIENIQLYSNGNTITESFFRDKWTIMYVGYTSCPDICPTTMAQIARVYEPIKSILKTETKVLFVSVDPERDKPKRLKQYVEAFNQEFLSATGTRDLLDDLVAKLNSTYKLHKTVNNPNYEVSHPAGIFIINPKGELEKILDKPAKTSELVTGVQKTFQN